MVSELRVTVRDVDGVVVVEPQGKITFDTLDLLRDALAKAAGEPVIVVDLSGTTMCDSSGLQLLIDLHRRIGVAGGALRLAAPSPLVLEVLRITRLDRYFALHDSLAEAAGG